MPLGLGKVVILEYIEVALGIFVVNDIGVAGSVSKRKFWRRGPNRPWGSIARGMRTMLRVRGRRVIPKPLGYGIIFDVWVHNVYPVT